jgi:hypothetical protein
MTFVPKPNTGSLWKNDKKTDDKHPDMRGDAVIDKRLLLDLISKGEDPVKIAVAAWNRTTNTGRDYTFITFSEPFIPQKKAEPAPKQQALDQEDDEDVPF